MSNMARELLECTTQVGHCFQINNLQFVDQETVYHVHYVLKNSPLSPSYEDHAGDGNYPVHLTIYAHKSCYVVPFLQASRAYAFGSGSIMYLVLGNRKVCQ